LIDFIAYVLEIWLLVCTTCTHSEDSIPALWNVYNLGTSWAWLKIAGTALVEIETPMRLTLALCTEYLLCEGLLVDPCRLCAQRSLVRSCAAVGTTLYFYQSWMKIFKSLKSEGLCYPTPKCNSKQEQH
jgi:hypothetical protein